MADGASSLRLAQDGHRSVDWTLQRVDYSCVPNFRLPSKQAVDVETRRDTAKASAGLRKDAVRSATSPGGALQGHRQTQAKCRIKAVR
jgi:hypothetical protein